MNQQSRQVVDDGQVRAKVVLKFPRNLVTSPVIWSLSQRTGLVFNILKADVDDGHGHLILELRGPASDYESALGFLSSIGVHAEPMAPAISLDRRRCSSCGACLPLCPTDSLVRDPETLEVELDATRCIACGACDKACPSRAISLLAIDYGES